MPHEIVRAARFERDACDGAVDSHVVRLRGLPCSDTAVMRYQGFIYSDDGVDVGEAVQQLVEHLGAGSARPGRRPDGDGIETEVGLDEDEQFWDVVRVVRRIAPSVQFGHVTPIAHRLVP